MYKTQIKRKPINITFSRDFESLLLAQDTKHLSLTDDLEWAVRQGLYKLEEFEDVRDLTNTVRLSKYIDQANKYSKITSNYFKYWVISISEEILDELELIKLTHGDELLKLGLSDLNIGSILVLTATAGLH